MKEKKGEMKRENKDTRNIYKEMVKENERKASKEGGRRGKRKEGK